jgi:hypothetical protein
VVRRKSLFAVLATLLWLTASALAEQPLVSESGFVDFSQQSLLSDDELAIHVSVKGPMIQLVAEATRQSDPELAEVLAKLKAVEVLVFEVDEKSSDAVRSDITRQAGELEKEGWSEAITIRLRHARGHVFLRLDEQQPVGLAALYHDSKANEAVFVNIVGEINPGQIGHLASKFELDLLSEAVRGQLPTKPSDDDSE